MLTATFFYVSDQVILVSLEYLELVALPDPPSLAHWGRLVYLAHLAQWDHQVRQMRPIGFLCV